MNYNSNPLNQCGLCGYYLPNEDLVYYNHCHYCEECLEEVLEESGDKL